MVQERKGRGFAALSTSELRRVSSAGGRASHQSGHGHEWSSQEARAAGARGGRPGQVPTAPVDRLRSAPSEVDAVEPSRTREREPRADDRVNAEGETER